MNVSSLEYTNLLGFFNIQVTKPVNISVHPVCLAPKPPPIRGLITLIFDFGISNAVDTIRRIWKGTCVELTIFKRS